MKKIFLKFNNKKGIALLFVLMLSSILLVVALSLSSIATKEAVFSTSTRKASDAFYAADTGAECALANDKTTGSAFTTTDPITGSCLGSNLEFNGTSDPWIFQISGLGSSSASCANVKVEKVTNTDLTITTTITSTGYSGACGSNIASNVVRELQVNY